MDPLTLGVGGGLVILGYVAGLVSRRRARNRQERNEPAAVCGCGHSLAMHDLEASTCHAEAERKAYDQQGERVGKEYIPCGCRRYIGPKPAEDILGQRMLPPS